MSAFNERQVKEVFFNKVDFRTIFALAMIKKSTGRLLVNSDMSMHKEDFIVGVSLVSENGEINLIFKSLEDVCGYFPEAFNFNFFKASEIFESDFVKKLEGEPRKCEQDTFEYTTIKCFKDMLEVCMEDAGNKTLSKLIEIAETVLDDEVRKANKKYEEYEYLSTCEVKDKVIILDKVVNTNNIASYLNQTNTDVLFAVLPSNNEYRYIAIPVAEGICIPRKIVPDKYTKPTLDEIRTTTGATSLKVVNMNGFGGVCGRLEDAVRMANLAASL